MIRKVIKGTLRAIGSILLIGALIFISIRPSNTRDWTLDQAILPRAEINGNKVLIHDIRNFTYRTTSDYTPGYYDKEFDLEKLRSVYFVVEPFSGFKGAAHTFLSFRFGDDDFVAISVEIRKEKGESFSAVKGLFRQYELMYVIADERDIVKLRSNYRKDSVYIYPIKTTQERKQALFLDMLGRANKLYEEPEFYNTLVSTCTTNIMSHVNKMVPGRVPFDLRVLLPEKADELAHELGLIDTDLTFEQAREKFLITELAERYIDDPDYSLRIRGE